MVIWEGPLTLGGGGQLVVEAVLFGPGKVPFWSSSVSVVLIRT